MAEPAIALAVRRRDANNSGWRADAYSGQIGASELEDARDMSDLLMMNLEFERCRARLQDLQAEIDTLTSSASVDIAAVENAARRMRELAEHLEAVTRAILYGSDGQSH